MSTDEEAREPGEPGGAAVEGVGPPAIVIEGAAVVAAGLVSVGVMLWGLGQEVQTPAWAVAGLVGLLASFGYAIMRIR
jgi:hypothetical protein